MEVGHDSWLTQTGYVVLFWGEALRVLSRSSFEECQLAHRGRQCRFCIGGAIFLLLLVPPKESFSLHLSRSQLMAFDGFGGVLNKWCSPLWVECWGVLQRFFPFSSRCLWAGWLWAQCNHLSSAGSVRESFSPPFHSVLLLFPVCLLVGISYASCCL